MYSWIWKLSYHSGSILRILSIVSLSLCSSHAKLLTSTLQVLTSLSKSVSLKSFSSFDPDSPNLRSIFLHLCYHDDLRVAAAACELFSDLALFSRGEEKDGGGRVGAFSSRTPSASSVPSNPSAELVSDAASALETFLVLSVQASRDVSSSQNAGTFPWNSVRRGMRCVIELCRSAPAFTVVGFIPTISTLLKIADDEMTLLLLETLAAIGSYNVGALRTIYEDLEDMLRSCRKSVTQSSRSSIDERRLELLCTLAFQAATTRRAVNNLGEPKDYRDIFGSISDILASRADASGVGNWSAYKISRQAARYGHHDIAIGILRRLSSCGVASSFFAAWLKGFHHLCRVEDILREMTANMSSTGVMDAMNDSAPVGIDDDRTRSSSPLRSLLAATEAAHLGVTQLTAAASATHPLTFPLQLARLRAASLQSCIQLLRASICLRTCPPPAIASSTLTGGGGAGGDATKGSRVSFQLHGVSKEFRSLADQINNLLQASFDADALSLKYLNLLRLSASILISAIDSLIIHAPSGGGSKNSASTRGLASTQVLNSLIGGADAFSLLDVKSTPLDLRRLVENCKSAMDKLSSIVENSSRPLPSIDKRVQLIQVC